MRLGFFVLLIWGVIKSCAVTFKDKGKTLNIDCNFPESQIQTRKASDWRSDYFNSMRICAVVTGYDNIKACKETSRTHVTMEVQPTTGGLQQINHFFPWTSFDASGTFCDVFNASEISTYVKGRDLVGTKIGAHAIVFADQKSTASTATLEVFADTAPYSFDEAGSLNAVVDNKFHSIVCKFPHCQITVVGPHKLVATERFCVKEGQAPAYAKDAVTTIDKMFSVTSILCETDAKCPTKFTAAAVAGKDDGLKELCEKAFSAAMPGLRSSLSIGIVLAVAVLVLEA